jgi:hypothetical protein
LWRGGKARESDNEGRVVLPEEDEWAGVGDAAKGAAVAWLDPFPPCKPSGD